MTDTPETATERAFTDHDAFLPATEAGDDTDATAPGTDDTAPDGTVPDTEDTAPDTDDSAAAADDIVLDADDTAADYRVTTTTFEATVGLPEPSSDEPEYSVVVRTPTLEAATNDAVGPAVAVGWFETFQKRLGDAPGATRHDVSLAAFGVAEDGDTVVVRYEFVEENPAVAADVAKTFTEYVEGTYVEGVVPGYEYDGAVADLIGQAAAQGSQGEAGGTPL